MTMEMNYWIAKEGKKVVGKCYGTKSTARQLYPDAELYPVEEDVFNSIRVGDEY